MHETPQKLRGLVHFGQTFATVATIASMPLFRTRARNAAIFVGSFLTIAIYCAVLSSRRMLWSDELFGWMMVTDPTWRHMLQAWRDGADGGGIVFYITCRLWMGLWGHSVLAFRAYSALGCWIGFVATWQALRRDYCWPIATAAGIAGWIGSRTILWQMVQTRFYGLLLAGAALSLLMAVITAETTPKPSSFGGKTWLAVIATVVANLILVGAHPFGVLYSALILAGSALSDWRTGRRRPQFYVAAVMPWSLLWFSRQALQNSARVGKPYFWTTRPHLRELIVQYLPSAIRPRPFAALLVVAILFALALKPVRDKLATGFRMRSALLFPALLLSLMPLFIFILSQHGTSYFVDRYLVPFAIGVSALIAEFSEALNAAFARDRTKPLRVLYASLGVCCALLLVIDLLWTYPRIFELPTRDYTNTLAADFPPGLPIVIERVDIFTTTIAQQHASGLPVFFLLDWPTTLAPDTPRGQVSGYREMENWQREGYYSGSILPVDSFLAQHKQFLVLRDKDLRWMDHRILHDPQWSEREINSWRYDDAFSGTIWLVERK